jgi:hypothetical protein
MTVENSLLHYHNQTDWSERIAQYRADNKLALCDEYLENQCLNDDVSDVMVDVLVKNAKYIAELLLTGKVQEQAECVIAILRHDLENYELFTDDEIQLKIMNDYERWSETE